MTNVPPWLTAFFGHGNLLSFEKLLGDQPGAYPSDLKSVLLPLVESAQDGRWPVILPWCDSQHWVFFATAENERTMLELSNVLDARLGSADVKPDRGIVFTPSLGPTAATEMVLLQHCPAGFIRIELLPAKHDDKPAKQRVFTALKEVIDLFRIRPSLVRTVKRPFGRILSDLILANSEKDASASDSYLQELRENGSLSRRNILLLELQQAGKLQRWDTLLNHENLPDLIRGRIPSSLVKILLNAYQHRFFYSNGGGYDQHTPAALRSHCLALYPLFIQVPLLSKDEADLNYWKSWAIGVALAGEPGLLDEVPDSLKTDWLPRLQAWAGLQSSIPIAPLIASAAQKPGSLQQLADYLRSSLTAKQDDIPSYEVMLKSLEPHLLDQALAVPLLKTLIDGIRQLSVPQIVSWDMWFSRLCQPDVDTNSLVQLVAMESEHWTTETFHEVTFIRLLSDNFPEGAFPALRNAMPAFVEWLEIHQCSLTSTTWLKWMDVLAMEKSVSQADIKLTTIAADHFLLGAFSQREYQEFIATLQLIIERSSSLRNLPLLSTLMELFLDAPCPSVHSRNELWSDIQAISLKLWIKIDYPLRTILRNLATDLLGSEAESVFPAEQEDTDTEVTQTLPDMSGKLVAIYTLTEGAARRTKMALETLFSGIKVDINHDHTATDKLIHLAKHADYFIFASGSAKHQALYAVTAFRRDLIYPLGKGGSSMLNAFLNSIQMQ